jgi:hypothetical protein
MYSQPQKTYGIAAAVDQVPPSLGSSSLPKPIASNMKTVSIVSSNGNQQQNGMISLTLPTGPGSGYLRSGSAYLRLKVAVTGGSGNATWSFKGPLNSASNIIRTSSIFVGGALVDQVQNSNLTHEMLLAHTTNSAFLLGDAALMQTSTVNYNTFALADSVSVVIPVISSLFNGQKHFPLFLLNSPILMQFDLESLFNCIGGAAGTGVLPTGYVVSEVQLAYDHISVDEAYKESVRMAMNEGRLFQLNLQQWQNTKISKGTAKSLTYNVGMNCSSINAVLHAISVDPTDVATARRLVSRTITDNNDFRVLLDGIQIENQRLNNGPVIYAEMNKCFANLLDPTQSFAATSTTPANTSTNYTTIAFTGGVNCRRFSEQMAMTGQPAQNVQFTLTTDGGETADDLVYLFVLYESILTIDASGAVVLIR